MAREIITNGRRIEDCPHAPRFVPHSQYAESFASACASQADINELIEQAIADAVRFLPPLTRYEIRVECPTELGLARHVCWIYQPSFNEVGAWATPDQYLQDIPGGFLRRAMVTPAGPPAPWSWRQTRLVRWLTKPWTLHLEIPMGRVIHSPWYALAYYVDFARTGVFYPFPLNLFVRWGRLAYHWCWSYMTHTGPMMCTREQWLDQLERAETRGRQALYEEGYKDGRQSALGPTGTLAPPPPMVWITNEERLNLPNGHCVLNPSGRWMLYRDTPDGIGMANFFNSSEDAEQFKRERLGPAFRDMTNYKAASVVVRTDRLPDGSRHPLDRYLDEGAPR